MNLAAVILAAGQGTRMKSNLPKVLHPIAGKPMALYALDSARALNASQTVLVIGHGSEQVREAFTIYKSPMTNGQSVDFVEQSEQRGTGHAVLQTRDLLRGKAEHVLVTYADMPLLKTETLRQLLDLHVQSRATISMLTIISDDSMGFGRIARDKNRRVAAIVEEADAKPAQLAIRELNCGVYCFDAAWLWENLPRVQPSGKKQEYYLTDLVAMAVKQSCAVESITIKEVSEAIGVNTRVHLAQVERMMRERINATLMLNGVTLRDPATTYVDAEVEIGVDTVIEPNTHIQGKTRVGTNCVIGPNAMIHDSTIGNHCRVLASVMEQSTLADEVDMGPFSRLRAGSSLASRVHLGNYVEVKNSRLGEEVAVGHFSYIGDAEIGARTNIGAGTITCNFDGARKNRTVIGEDVFIGSDTMLVAPVKIGNHARTGAGSVVTKDVPDHSLAVGAPARVIRKM